MISTERSAIAAEFTRRFSHLAEKLGPDHLNLLLDGASVQEVPAGRAVIRDRMPVDFLYFVLDGSLGVYIENADKSQRIATVQPGEWLGEISVLSGEMLASATITPDSVSKLMKIHHLTFEKLIAEDEVVAKALLEDLIGLMAKRLRTTQTNG
ncbi:MAG: cyclic nucleotide-binding domain-containing protein [Proteobacteria bacterium]|nr:cyclic nucleotide-binding domain-containing protein [Pseudomonadota bacterium]